jgi:hypothetical protein
MIEGCCIVRPVMATSSQGRTISDSADADGNAASSSNTSAAEDSRDVAAARATADDDGDDHADTDIGMDLSSSEDDREEDATAAKLNHRSYPIFPHYHILSNNMNGVIRPPQAAPLQQQQQEQHVTDESEASAPDYNKKRRRRPSESTSTTPSPSLPSTPPTTTTNAQSCPPSLPNDQYHDTTKQQVDDPAAVSNGSPGNESATGPLPTPPPTIKDDNPMEQGTSSGSPDCISSLPQHQHQQQAPLDISYRSTPASLKLKETLLSRLSMSFPTGRIQVVRSIENGSCIGILHNVFLNFLTLWLFPAD